MVIVMMVRLNTMIAIMMMVVVLLMLFLMMMVVMVTDLATGSMLRSSGSILTMRPDMRPV